MGVSWLAVCIYIAILILHSYQPSSMLSWAQRQRRRRSLLLITLVCSAALVAEKFQKNPNWPIVSFVFAAITSIVFLRHLRREGSKWSDQRMIHFSRFTLIGFSFFVATLSIYRPDVWSLICILFGFWNASTLKRESTEITGEFSHLKTRLASIYAEHRNQKNFPAEHSSDIRDNSIKAS